MHIRGLVILLAIAGLTAGCDSGGHKATPNPHPLKVLRNDLKGGKLVTKHLLKGDEPVTIRTTYSTDYNTAAWKITDSKTLHFEALAAAEPGVEILLEHVHADVGLSATKQALNGMPQDSMDAHLHVGLQPGVQINQHPYRNDFVIEGYSQTLTSGWGFMVSGTGALGLDEKRLTENNLKDEGVNGNKFMFVYIVLVKWPGEKLWHENEFKDEFIVKVR